MIDAAIDRIETSRQGTIGVLRIDGKVHSFTLEPPDRGNAPDISCIPPGQYACQRVTSPTRGEVFEVTNVTGRSHILIHIGNTSLDTQGCILPGRRVGHLEGLRAVLDSGGAYYDFMQIMAEVDEFPLTIRNAY